MSRYAELERQIDRALHDYERYKGDVAHDVRQAQVPVTTDYGPRAASMRVSEQTFSGKTGRNASQGSHTTQDSKASAAGERKVAAVDDGQARAQAKIPSDSAFAAFVVTAQTYEYRTFAVDLDFLRDVAGGSNVLKAIKTRDKLRRSLWKDYTADMQAMAVKFKRTGHTGVTPGLIPSTTQTSWHAAEQSASRAKSDLRRALDSVSASERTCAETLADALGQMRRQAFEDINLRYDGPSPIEDKVTPVITHNHRIRAFNEVVKFVADDLRQHNSPAVGAVEALAVADYPPYK
ncbi:hypothetical protein PYCC9005_002761 [Savitreella phatthalungensis]